MTTQHAGCRFAPTGAESGSTNAEGRSRNDGDRPLTCYFLVGDTGQKLNHTLAAYLRRYLEAAAAGEPLVPDPAIVEAPDQSTPPSMSRRRRLADRLTQEQIAALVDAFNAGTPLAELARDYGISLSTVKRQLRARGASRATRTRGR